jgi:hypothetical protein
MADRVLARLERMTADEWNYDNPHNRILVALFCLECFLLRAKSPDALADRLRAIADKRSKRSLIGQRIGITVNGPSSIKGGGEDFTRLCSYLVIDKRMLDLVLEEFPSWDVDAQHFYVFGPKVLSEDVVEPMRRDPKYKQNARAEEFGVFDHPAVAGLLGTQASSLAGKAKKPLGQKELDKAAKALIATLVADINKVRGKKQKEKAIWIAAVHQLIELRAAAGHECPEELIGHILGVDGWGPKDPPAFEMLDAKDDELDRWFNYIDEATG